MADFNTSGINEQLLGLMGLVNNLGRITGKMIRAARDELIDAWKDGIQKNGFIDTGAMYSSVGGEIYNLGGEGRCTDVYPQGVDGKGVRNAEKAFILHYGKPSMPASYFLDKVEKVGEEKANEVAQAILDEELAKLG